MNLQGVCYWSTQHPFLDRFKTSANWTAYADVTASSAPVPIDANGYPTGLPTGANMIMTQFDIDPISAGQSDVYELTYSGNATFALPGATILSSSAGKVVFKYDGDSSSKLLQITGLDSAHPVSDIHIVRQDQVALFNSGEMFNPAFIKVASGWDTLRFKDWEATDNSNISSWSQHTSVSSASWSAASTSLAGVPIEVQVQLANETHSNMWINMPTAADDDYVRRTLTYVHDHLDAGLTVKVEYSNEVWNWGYTQSHYAMDKADSLWGTDANHDGVIDASDPAEHVSDGWVRYYGYRSAQVASIAQSVFADDTSRVQGVLATQTTYTGLENGILAGVAQANLGSPGALFDSYAVTTYFGMELDGATSSDQAKVLGWARSGSAGVDAAFRELEFGDQGFSQHSSLADMAPIYAYQAAIAKSYGMTMDAYEGGAHLTAGAYDPSVQGEIIAFFEKLDEDPRMGDLYTKMAAQFNAAGGTELSAFIDTATPSLYGTFGLLDSVYDDGSPRYDALRAVQQSGDVPAIKTALSSFTLDDFSSGLTYTGTAAFVGTGNDFDNVITGGPGGSTLYGCGGSDVLNGGVGNDLLDGGTGADRMQGGAGNDIYYMDDVGDVAVELTGGGTDEVRTTLASYTLGDAVENLTHSAATPFTGTGNALDNLITGGDGGNWLYGLAGDDTLVGGSGNDVLDGGIGADRMTGGAGNDIYYVDRGDVVTEAAGGGTDEIRTALTKYTLTDNVENLTSTGTAGFRGTGNDLNNLITGGTGSNTLFGMGGDDSLVGGSGKDTLDGGTGADHMTGGAGNDTYIVDNPNDMVVEAADGGRDTVKVALASYVMPNEVENLIATGVGSFTAWGNAANNTITGSVSAANWLAGGDGNDSLAGGSAADHLDGGAGVDTMTGGAGDDVYTVDDSRDKVVEQADGGSDWITSTASYTLPTNVETLQLAGTDAIDGTGNTLANLIVGNAAANILRGGAGDDTLLGGDGDDRLNGGSGADVLHGDQGNDRLTGSSGDDVLDGGDGNDFVTGGAGRDIAYGGTGGDRFVFAPGDFATAPDATTSPTVWADVIGDFSHAEGDRIDLSAFDAIAATAADDAFKFIGGNGFSNHAGELRMDAYSGSYDVSGDLDGDGKADFHLIVFTSTPLVAADFIL